MITSKKIITSKKRGQTWSMEAFGAIMIFMVALVVFYALTSSNTSTEDLEKEAEIITKSVGAQEYFSDGIINEDEIAELQQMDCDQLKKLFQTNKELCVYMANEDGSLVNYNQPKPLAFGCPGLEIGGEKCGFEKAGD